MNISYLNFNSETAINKIDYFWCSAKAYIEDNSMYSDKLYWNYPINCSNFESVTAAADFILAENPDVVMSSIYIWNVNAQLAILKEIKNKRPSVIIICGGPQLDFSDVNFFKEHNYIDFCCAPDGYGEVFLSEFFCQLFTEKKWDEVPFLLSSKITKVCEFKKRAFQWPKDVFKRNSEYIFTVKKYAYDNNLKFGTIFEGSRGCPYGCTFCEWGGGSSTKMVFKPTDSIISDIDFLLTVVEVNWLLSADSNFGMLPRDEEIAQAIIEKNNGSCQNITLSGPAKAKAHKERLYRIEQAFDNSKIGFERKISIQDLSEDVKQNIDRIDVDWKTQLASYKARSNDNSEKIRIELIIGLPGASLDYFYLGMDEFYPNNMAVSRYEWILLPNTPAAKTEYIEKFDIQTTDIRNIVKMRYDNTSLLSREEFAYAAPCVVSATGYSKSDWIQIYCLGGFLLVLEDREYITPITKFLANNINTPIKHSEFYKTFWEDFIMGNIIGGIQGNTLIKAVQTLFNRIQTSEFVKTDDMNRLPEDFSSSHYYNMSDLIEEVIHYDIVIFFASLYAFITSTYPNLNITELQTVVGEAMQSVEINKKNKGSLYE